MGLKRCKKLGCEAVMKYKPNPRGVETEELK
jgi:hypothetical protein